MLICVPNLNLNVYPVQRYERRRKMQKFGWFRRLGITKVISNIAVWQSTYDFLFDFNRNYASILYRFRVVARRVFRRKWPILTHVTSICRPRMGWPSSNFAVVFSIKKLESRAIVRHYLRDPTFIYNTGVCRTYRQIHDDGIASIALRGKNRRQDIAPC